MSVQIPLTNSELFALVDNEDWEKVSFYKWYISTRGYVVAYIGRKNGKPRFSKLHRFVLGLKKSDPNIDHKNRDKLDCRKENLRPATAGQNGQNQSRLRPTSRSGYRNVHWDAARQKWRACIRVGGRAKTTKYFTDLEEAVQAAHLLRRAWMPYATE